MYREEVLARTASRNRRCDDIVAPRNGTQPLGEKPERGVLVGVQLPTSVVEDPPLAELAGLAQAAGVEVVGQLTQRRMAPDAATYIGSGKLEELKKLVQSQRADRKGRPGPSHRPDAIDPRYLCPTCPNVRGPASR